MSNQLRAINLNNALRCKDFLKIGNSACKKYKKNINKDELKQIKRIALWMSLAEYNKNKKCKFKTYLYYRTVWACGNYLSKSYKKENNNVSLDNVDVEDKRCYSDEVENRDFFLESLNKLEKEEKTLMMLRFCEKKTLQELSNINGFTKQWNRIRIIKILEKIKSGVNKYCNA